MRGYIKGKLGKLYKMDSTDSDEDFEITKFYDGEEESDDFNLASRNNNDSPNMLYEYELLSHNGLVTIMKNEIYKISNILIVSEVIARCLLNYYKWNKEQLLDDYYNSRDINVFFQSAGIDNPSSVVDMDGTAYSEPLKDCGICFTSFSQTRAIFLLCGHQFCSNCCGQYFQAKVLNDGEGNMIKCPDPDCKMLIDDATIMELIPDNVKHRFETLITQTFVLSNPLLRFCQSADCKYTIKVQKVESLPVICKCGFESCFSCGQLWHDSVSCALLEKWIRCSVDDAESFKWIQENAKKCPKCTINIEKNGGCNHMRCRSCHYEFCWLCLKDWRAHASCNQFEPNEQNITQRLVHYSVRYNNHIQSLDLERGLYTSIESKMKDLQGMASLTRNEVLFLKRAVDSLRRSRQILISTYVFAYYSKKSNQLLMFEDNQRDLELATENLSWFLEQDITNESMVRIKQKLQEKYTYCDQRRSVLLDHINEGYEKKYWQLED